MNGDNDEGIRDRKLIHTSWRGMGAPSICGHTSGYPVSQVDSVCFQWVSLYSSE